MHPITSNLRALLLTLALVPALAACGGYGASGGAAVRSSGSYGGSPSVVYAAAAADSQGSGGYGSYESAAPASAAVAPAPEPDPRARPGLATRFGETRHSVVGTTRFTRASSTPLATAALHYNDAAGTTTQVAMRAASGAGHVGIGGAAHRVNVSLVDEYGRELPAYHVDGEAYVMGQPGERYALRVDNQTPYRFEVVMSVDGLDVVDGEEASFGKRGYIINPGASLVVEGFRTSSTSVAAFRFGSVGESYAARSTGSARNVGVVGVALFAEAGVHVDLYQEAALREQADPFPGRYAVPPPGY